MTRGKPTPPELKEQAIALAITTGNQSETSRIIGLPRTTVRSLVTDDEFASIRQQAQEDYVLKTWDNILAIEVALRKKLDTTDTSKLPLTEITRALKDLKGTVENVINNIHIGNNVQVNNFSAEEALETAYELVAEKHGLSVSDLMRRIDREAVPG